MNQTRWIYFFAQGQADAGTDLKHLVGGKGASLADMTRAGLNVPPGFTISAECCDLFYKNQNQLPAGLMAQVAAAMERLEGLACSRFGKGDNPLLVAVRSGAAQSMPGMMDTILNVGLNPDCVRAMGERTLNPRGAWEAYLHHLLMYVQTVLVPAGTIGEYDVDELDELVGPGRGDDLNAGQLEGLCQQLIEGFSIRTDPWAVLEGAILAVFRSWNTDRALSYRKHHKIDGLLGTAVNVQMMCPSEVSGVMFTANPVNPALDEIIIESSYGLGEAIVLGKVTPDRFVLDKERLTIRERNISVKDNVVATLAQDGKARMGARDAASLDDAQIQELAKLGQRVETYFGHPCDIEWGLSQGQFYLLQARAIKTAKGAPSIDLSEREMVRQEEIAVLKARTAPGGTVWSRFNLAEILPEPTPMTWSIVKQFMSGQGGFGLMYRDLGFDPDPALDEEGIFDLVCGRPYCNLSREPRMQYKSLPFEHKLAVLKANPAKAMYPQAVLNLAKAGWRFWLFLPGVFFKLWRSNMKLQHISKTFAHKFENEIVPPFLAEVAAAARDELRQLSNQQLLKRLNHWIKRTLYDFSRESLKPTALAAVAMGNLERPLALRYQPPGSPMPAKDQPTGLQKAKAAIGELVMGVKPAPEADLAGGIRDFAAGRLSRAEFLSRFGHRGSQEMELAKPRWAEDADAVDRMGRDQHPDALMHEHASDDAMRKKWDQIAADIRLTPPQRRALEAEVETLKTFLALREAGKHHLMRGYALIRQTLVELDRRHNLDGGIFFLTLEDLPGLVSSDAGELRTRIDLQRRRREIALSLPVPQVLFSDDLEAIGREVEVDGTANLQGVGLSAGVVEGTAWVLAELAGARAPAEPYILVCPSTDPAWVPLFGQARGLVMETGGVLSHGAIVAREFVLPAVAGIADVHRRIKTGQRLRLDGATGKVTVLSPTNFDCTG